MGKVGFFLRLETETKHRELKTQNNILVLEGVIGDTEVVESTGDSPPPSDMPYMVGCSRRWQSQAQ